MSESAKRMRQTYQVTGDKWFLTAAEEIDQLREALKPFADLWERKRRHYLDARKSGWIDRMPGDWPAECGGGQITIKMLRDAKAAYSADDQPEPKDGGMTKRGLGYEEQDGTDEQKERFDG